MRRGWVVWVFCLMWAGYLAGQPQENADIESTEILERAPVTENAEVKHVLIAWADLAPAYRGQIDPRARARSRDEAVKLTLEIYKKAGKGTKFEDLMKEFSEDPGSGESGRSYNATPTSQLVPPFRALSLRLNPGEVGIVRTNFGYHVIKRIK